MTRGFYYFCQWDKYYFIIFAKNRERASAVSSMEFMNKPHTVRRATSEEIEKYCKLKKVDQEWSWARIMGKTPEQSKEANRRFQMTGYII